MRSVTWVMLLLATLVVPPRALAVIGTIDVVPAATLLLPYFEVELDDPGGVTTLLSVNNAEAAPIAVHVVLWSDLGVPTFGFDVLLTGYDVVTLNLRDVFNGVLPAAANARVSFPNCGGGLPPPQVPPTYVAHLRAAHTGNQSPLDFFCYGGNQGDGVARGYVTVDVVNQCSVLVPGDAGYFGAGGVATNDNALWGDYFLVDPDNNFGQGDTLVHIEADGSNPETSVPGQYTFYGRHVGWTAADNREPLATTFGARFLNGSVFTGGTRLTGWRDSKVNQSPFPCGFLPNPYPLSQQQLVVFDEAENPDVPPFIPFFPPLPPPDLRPFPRAAGDVVVGGPDLPVPFNFGWLYLNLNHTVAGPANPPENPAAAQAWVTPLHSALGRFSVGVPALQLDNASDTTLAY